MVAVPQPRGVVQDVLSVGAPPRRVQLRGFRLVVGMLGDMLNLKNEVQFPFMPTYGANAPMRDSTTDFWAGGSA